MVEIYPLKTIVKFGDWFTYGTDFVPGLGVSLLAAIFVVFFTRTYNGRNFNGAFTSSMFITTLSSLIFFWLDFLNPNLVSVSIVLTLIGIFTTGLSKRAGA